MTAKPLPPVVILHALLAYSADTGLFFWRDKTNAKRSADGAAGTLCGGYIRIRVCGGLHKTHRIAYKYVHEVEPEGFIDHINGKRTDNRISNLRIVTASGNSQNRTLTPPNRRVGKLMGAYLYKDSGKYGASICINGNKHYLGLFATEALAHQAYLTKKLELHTFFEQFNCGRLRQRSARRSGKNSFPAPLFSNTSRGTNERTHETRRRRAGSAGSASAAKSATAPADHR